MGARLVPIVCGLLAACSSSSAGSPPDGATAAEGATSMAGTLDCAWLEMTNCWSETIGAAASCLPPSTQQGTLSSDQRTCTYASGTTVAFGAPLNVGQNEMLSSFTMTTAGKQCLAVNQGSTGIWVTTSAGTVSVTLDKTSTTLTVTCPDGEAYSGPYTILNSCPDSVPGSSEATVTSFNPDGGPTEGTFSLSLGDIGDGGTGSLSVFACATP